MNLTFTEMALNMGLTESGFAVISILFFFNVFMITVLFNEMDKLRQGMKNEDTK